MRERAKVKCKYHWSYSCKHVNCCKDFEREKERERERERKRVLSLRLGPPQKRQIKVGRPITKRFVRKRWNSYRRRPTVVELICGVIGKDSKTSNAWRPHQWRHSVGVNATGYFVATFCILYLQPSGGDIPVPIRSSKSSTVERGWYQDGWLPGNSPCCRQHLVHQTHGEAETSGRQSVLVSPEYYTIHR